MSVSPLLQPAPPGPVPVVMAPAAASPMDRAGLLAAVAAGALLISAAHYLTGPDLRALHDLFRRLYYLPIVVAAVTWGARGGLLAAVGCSLLYAPHAFMMGHHHGDIEHQAHIHVLGMAVASDPSSTTEKFFEIVMFHGVGAVTGLLSQRWTRALARAEALSAELRQVLAAREAVQEQLVRTEKLAALGSLSAGLAHELRNPLGSIRGAAEVLAEDFPDGHRKHAMAEIMLKELDRLNGVLTSFLQFARPPRPDPRTVDLDQVVDSVVGLVAPKAALARTEVTVEHLAGDARCWADPGQVQQVLLNLVINAVEALGGAGHVAVRVTRAAGDRVVVDVTDDGPGVPPELAERIFEPFFSTKDTGTGLGLAVSHSLAEANGGHLRLVGGGPGARLRLDLPAAGGDHAG